MTLERIADRGRVEVRFDDTYRGVTRRCCECPERADLMRHCDPCGHCAEPLPAPGPSGRHGGSPTGRPARMRPPLCRPRTRSGVDGRRPVPAAASRPHNITHVRTSRLARADASVRGWPAMPSRGAQTHHTQAVRHLYTTRRRPARPPTPPTWRARVQRREGGGNVAAPHISVHIDINVAAEGVCAALSCAFIGRGKGERGKERTEGTRKRTPKEAQSRAAQTLLAAQSARNVVVSNYY